MSLSFVKLTAIFAAHYIIEKLFKLTKGKTASHSGGSPTQTTLTPGGA